MVHLIQSASHIYGAERCLLLELGTLRQRGHDARVVMLLETRQGDAAFALARALQAEGVPVELVPTPRQVSPGMLRDLYRALQRLRPDLIHSHSMKTDVLGFVLTRLLRLPFLVEVHGWVRPDDDRVVRAYEALDRAVLRHCEGALVLSREYRDELVGLGVPASRVHLLPSGIDVEGLCRGPVRRDLRAELGLSREVPVLGMVARLSPEKGHRDFLEVLRRVQEKQTGPAPVGLIVGDGPLREELAAQAARLGLSGTVHFTGYVPEIADAYRAMDVLVSCSLYEGLPLNLIEAMALSRPVLSTATGGCAEIVVDGETGFLVPRGDLRLLEERLLGLCADPGLRRRMGEAGQRRAQACYSLSAWAEGAEGIYARVLREQGRGRAAA